jgi:hypothetical protein
MSSYLAHFAKQAQVNPVSKRKNGTPPAETGSARGRVGVSTGTCEANGLRRRLSVRRDTPLDSHRAAEPRTFFPIGDGGGDEGPGHECGDASLAGVCADGNVALRRDRSAGADADGVDRADGDDRVPELRVNGRAHGALSDAAILQKPLGQGPARKEAAALRAEEEAKASRR